MRPEESSPPDPPVSAGTRDTSETPGSFADVMQTGLGDLDGIGPRAGGAASIHTHDRPRRPRRRGTRTFFLLGIKLGVILVLAWGLLFNFSEVRGSSMEPGILDRDRILVDHFTYLLGPVRRGDVVVLRYPLDPSLDYIKRVIGLPGDKIEIFAGAVWVNGERIEEPYVDKQSMDPYSTVDTTVRSGHYYVLGDNRLRSSDSREFGQVPFEYLRGKVRLRLWPLDRLGLVE